MYVEYPEHRGSGSTLAPLVFLGFSAVLFGAIIFVAFIPCATDFSRHRYLEGQVLDIGSRFAGESRSEERYAIQLELFPNSDPEVLNEEGVTPVVTCDDTKCSVLNKSDKIGLNCAYVRVNTGPRELICSLTKIIPRKEN